MGGARFALHAAASYGKVERKPSSRRPCWAAAAKLFWIPARRQSQERVPIVRRKGIKWVINFFDGWKDMMRRCSGMKLCHCSSQLHECAVLSTIIGKARKGKARVTRAGIHLSLALLVTPICSPRYCCHLNLHGFEYSMVAEVRWSAKQFLASTGDVLHHTLVARTHLAVIVYPTSNHRFYPRSRVTATTSIDVQGSFLRLPSVWLHSMPRTLQTCRRLTPPSSFCYSSSANSPHLCSPLPSSHHPSPTASPHPSPPHSYFDSHRQRTASPRMQSRSSSAVSGNASSYCPGISPSDRTSAMPSPSYQSHAVCAIA